MVALVKPHGADALKPLYVADEDARVALQQEAESLPSVVISSAAAANAVMMGAGYFTPLTGYMNKADMLSVAENMTTADGLFWPVPEEVCGDHPGDGIATGCAGSGRGCPHPRGGI